MGSGAVKADVGPDAESCAAPVRSTIDGSSGSTSGDRIAACFKKFDVDGSGTISVHELMRVLEICGTPVSAKDLGALFSEVDQNKDGVIDYREFVAWLYPSSSPSRTPSKFTDAAPSWPSTSSPTDKKCLQSSAGLLVLLHSASQLPSSSSECNASATAFVSKGGMAMLPKVQWASSQRCSNPCWNAARDLGCHTFSSGDTPSTPSSSLTNANVMLHIEISGNNSLIGDVRLLLQDIVMDRWYELPLELTRPPSPKKGVERQTPSVRFMIMTEPSLVKKVFLVRHGESVWNKAQREMKVAELLEQVDHPLSDEGIKQCNDLSGRIEGKMKSQELSPNEAQFLDAEIALSSPLTRAIQTALVGIHPIIKRLKHLRLCRSAREKRNFGGRDTSGTAMGEAEIVHRAHSALRDGGVQEADIDRYLATPLDSTEANGRWWNDSRESRSSVRERLTEFMSQMRFLREERIIVVGHSHFFRALINQGLTSSASIVGASRDEVTSKKLVNCGVMAITLDFRKGADQPITEVELLLGSQLC